MGRVLSYDQLALASFATAVVALPAGTTLQKARLDVYTWFASQNTTVVIQQAPPNTLLGISWVPHGTAVPIITTANWRDSEWYIAGPGVLDAFDRWTYNDVTSTPNAIYVQQVYANHIELDVPLFESGAFDLGMSINWLGSGFWTSNQFFISYQFQGWFD